METALPIDFICELRETLGAEHADALVMALDTEPVVGVRFNPRKLTSFPDLADCTTNDSNGEPYFACRGLKTVRRVPWCKQGVILPDRPQFTLMPEWHAGCLYVQEPSSMIISAVVKRLVDRLGRADIRYLDMCAAPGGKTTAALSALPDEAFVVANEFVPTRAAILVENLTKWGYPNHAVTVGDTSAYRKLKGMFDIVAIDAPCSGEGMMRKDEEARRQWSPSLVRQCAALQREILDNAWTALRPGGYLIYSTCTFNRIEDEDNLHYAVDELGAKSVDLGLNEEFGIPGSVDAGLPAMRFMPHVTPGEGIFMCVLQKPGIADDAAHKEKGKKRSSGQKPAVPRELPGMLTASDTFVYEQTKTGLWRGIPKAYTDLVTALDQHTRLLTAGVTLGEFKGKNFVPDAALALSTSLSPEAFPRIDADLETALNYLRREAITLPAGTPQGIILICYEGHPLGFAKNLGNRANNLYPRNWRIRHL